MRHGGAGEAHQHWPQPPGGLVPAAHGHLRPGRGALSMDGARRAAAGKEASRRPGDSHRDHELLLLPQRLRPRRQPPERARQGQCARRRLVRHCARPERHGGRGLGTHRAADRSAGRRRSRPAGQGSSGRTTRAAPATRPPARQGAPRPAATAGSRARCRVRLRPGRVDQHSWRHRDDAATGCRSGDGLWPTEPSRRPQAAHSPPMWTARWISCARPINRPASCSIRCSAPRPTTPTTIISTSTWPSASRTPRSANDARRSEDAPLSVLVGGADAHAVGDAVARVHHHHGTLGRPPSTSANAVLRWPTFTGTARPGHARPHRRSTGRACGTAR